MDTVWRSCHSAAFPVSVVLRPDDLEKVPVVRGEVERALQEFPGTSEAEGREEKQCEHRSWARNIPGLQHFSFHRASGRP